MSVDVARSSMTTTRRHPITGVRLPSTPPPITYVIPHETTSPKFGHAFANGCQGPERVLLQQPRLDDGDFASFCTPATWGLLKQAIADGRNWYYGDHAYYRRGRYYRITKNAYQYQPSPAEIASARPDRFKLAGMQAAPTWRQHGSTIVICPNSDVYMRQFYGAPASDWIMDVVRQVAKVSSRNIVVRFKAQADKRPLQQDLHDAWAVVVYNSNAAVEALQAGVPVFVTCPWASTASMGLSDLSKISEPYYPVDRVKFLWALAYRQWTLQEIASGVAWKALQT